MLASRESPCFDIDQPCVEQAGIIPRRDSCVNAWMWNGSNTQVYLYTYALSNAPVDTPLGHLAWLLCQRYFIERTNQDAKSEAGWDELEARKYRGWEHHLALVILATWFIAQV